MKYRVLGRTGLKVSEFGLGGHEYRRWLPEERDKDKFLKTQPHRNILVKRLIDAGVNYFDTTEYKEAESLGLALKALEKRENVYVSVMIVGLFKKMEESPPGRWRDIIFDGVQERMKALQTDRIDIFRICSLEKDYSRDRLETTLKVLEEIKDQGKIGSIGASSHELRFSAELVRKYDSFDSMMIPYNYYLQEAKDSFFFLCRAFNIGIVVMKPLAWPYYGISFTHFGSANPEKGDYSAAQTSLRWILLSREVASVVVGINSLDELEENLDAFTKEGKIDENILEQHLQEAKNQQGKEKLIMLLEDPSIDVRNYAKRALMSGPWP